MYSSLIASFRVKLQGERCTNPTFSRIHILHARLHPPKGFESFGVLRRSPPCKLRLQAISRHLRPPEDVILRLSAAKVLIFKLVLLSSTCHLRPADGAIDCLLRSPEGDSFKAPQVAGLRLVFLSVRPSPSVPKVSFSVPGVFVGTEHPSCALVTQHQSPVDRLGDVFEAGINLRAHSRRSNPQ